MFLDIIALLIGYLIGVFWGISLYYIIKIIEYRN